MCDIYMDKCKVCGLGIEMHLGDYSTKSNEIEVYCKQHIPKDDVIVWKCNTGLKKYKTYNVGVRALTDNAIKNRKYNHPNTTENEVVRDTYETTNERIERKNTKTVCSRKNR